MGVGTRGFCEYHIAAIDHRFLQRKDTLNKILLNYTTLMQYSAAYLHVSGMKGVLIK